MQQLFTRARTLCLLVVVIAVTSCNATKLREHNLQLESLIDIRQQAQQQWIEAERNGSLSRMEVLGRYDSVMDSLAELSLDAAEDAAIVDSTETKVAYYFTAARAGSKSTGEAMNRAHKARAEKNKNKDNDAPAKKDTSEIFNPFYFGIVVPAKAVCKSIEKDWQRPARDCAYLDVVAYFAAVDEYVAQAQALEANRGGASPVPDGLVGGYRAVFDGLDQQFANIESDAATVATRYQVSNVYKTFLYAQMFRTFCSADKIASLLNPFGGTNQLGDIQSERIEAWREDVKSKITSYYKPYGGGGGYDCAKALTS